MFSWLQALEAMDEENRTKAGDEEAPPPTLGLSGLPLATPSPLNPASKLGGSAYASLLAPQKPASRTTEEESKAADQAKLGPPQTPGPPSMPTVPGLPTAPASRKESDTSAFAPLPSPTFGTLPAITPPPPLTFEDMQRVDQGTMQAPAATPLGNLGSPGFTNPQAMAFPGMPGAPAMPATPAAPSPIQFADMGAPPGLNGSQTGLQGLTGTNTSNTGTQTGTNNQTGTTNQTGTQTNQQQSGLNSDLNTALTLLGLTKPAVTALGNLTGPSKPTTPATTPVDTGPMTPEPTPLTNPEWFIDPLGGPSPTVNPVDNPSLFVDPLGMADAATKAPTTTTPAVTPPTTGAPGSQSLIGQGINAALGPETGAVVNQALPYVGAVLTAALGLANGKPPEQALLAALPSLMQSQGVQNLISSTVGGIVGTEAAGLVTQSLPYVGPVLNFALSLAGGQDPGQAALNTAIGIAAAALAPETGGLSVVVGGLLQYVLSGAFGPSEAWQQFGKHVGNTIHTNIAAVDELVPAIIAAKTPEELEAVRAKYVSTLMGDKLDPETGQKMAFTPHDGQYLPDMSGATGTAHEWGKNFNPNELNAALNQLYGTKLTSLTQGLGDPNSAMQYLTQILPIIQQGATGAGGNPVAMPTLYSSLTPAGPSLPPLTPPPVVPFVAENAGSGSA